MGIIYFDEIVLRERNDGRPVLFTWPRTGKTFSYTFSKDNGATFSAGAGSITELPPDGDVAEYSIPYLVAERPAATGTVIYNVNDGIDSAKIYVNILSGRVSIGAPGTPAGDTFTSLEEMQRVFSEDGVDNHTEDYVSNTVVIDEIIYRATETVLQFLRGRYTLAGMAASYWVRMKATFIACYLLSVRQGNPSLYGDLYAEAMLDLAQARDGLINPGLATSNRVIVQTPMMDSRFFHPGRINPARSTKIYSGQRLPFRLSNYE